MSFSTKTFAVGSLLFGAAASGAGAQTLNPMDLYLSVVEKEALLPEKQQRRISVTIGNGTTSYPTDRAATLTVTMDEALANSIVAENLGNSWGTSSYAGVSCDPITKPFTVVNGRVDATCTIPILPTGAKFDLGIELIGQEAWTSHYLGAKITPLAGERFTNNQSESLVITSVEVADLSIQTVVKQAGNPDQTITPTSGATIAALGGESFSFEAMVTNNGSSSADSFVVTVPRLSETAHIYR